MRMMIAIARRFWSERFHDQSALMAYYFLLAIFPFLLFAISVASFLPIEPAALLDAIEPYAPKNSFHLIEQNVKSLIGEKQAKWAYLSLLAAFWIASMAVQALVRSMNEAYRVVRTEPFLLAIGKDLLLTAGLMLTLTISLFVPIGEEIGRLFISAHFELPVSFYKIWIIMKWSLGSIYLFFFFTFLYWMLPSKEIPIFSAWPGALFATIGWQAVSVTFSYYVTYWANYTRLYGYVANTIVLMVWFYFTAAVLLIGGLINAYWILKKESPH